MKFTTAIGKLSIKETTIRQSRIIEKGIETQILKLVGLGFILYTVCYEFILPNFENWNPAKRVIMYAVFSIVIVSLLIQVYEFIFLKHWGKDLSIPSIEKINITTGNNKLETKVGITLKSKRIKSYHFRTLENQHPAFIDALCAINPDIKMLEKGKEATVSVN